MKSLLPPGLEPHRPPGGGQGHTWTTDPPHPSPPPKVGTLTTWRLGAQDGGTEWAGWRAWWADMDSVSLPGRVGEGRACWSLGNAYVSMGSPAQALTFAKKHLEISQEVSRACPALSPESALCQR